MPRVCVSLSICLIDKLLFSLVQHTCSILIVRTHWLVRHGGSVSWASPNGVLHVLLVCHSVLDWVLDVLRIFANRLVVALLWEITNLKWTKLWRVSLHLVFLAEFPVTSVSLSQWIERSVLVHLASVWLRLVKNLSSASLIVQLPDIFFPLVSILNVIEAVGEGLIWVPSQEVHWSLFWPWSSIIILLHMDELRMPCKFPITTRLERCVADAAGASSLSEDILWILILIPDRV